MANLIAHFFLSFPASFLTKRSHPLSIHLGAFYRWEAGGSSVTSMSTGKGAAEAWLWQQGWGVRGDKAAWQCKVAEHGMEGQKHDVHACNELPGVASSVGAWARGEQASWR